MPPIAAKYRPNPLCVDPCLSCACRRKQAIVALISNNANNNRLRLIIVVVIRRFPQPWCRNCQFVRYCLWLSVRLRTHFSTRTCTLSPGRRVEHAIVLWIVVQARSQDFTLVGEAQKLRGCTFSDKKLTTVLVVALKNLSSSISGVRICWHIGAHRTLMRERTVLLTE